ncbi:HlyD family type I secretion periplasmic adaptor subunit [Rhodoligotrophos ferricapiens]|uniref:HlyD family type I secretion periplasmic adaptor subunit n=1 Tax=Rhodoligotrophos ferricapiens TaxID=3069264 RepID=UPI00315DB88C
MVSPNAVAAPQQLTEAMFASSEEEARKALNANRRSLLKVSTIGLLVVGIFLFGAGTWAAVAPLASAAMARGVVSPEGYRRTVQHLEGGIIQEILVHDGSRVKEGDTLIVLDATQNVASLDVLQVQRYGAAAALARLDTEVEGRDKITYPEWLLQAAEKDHKAAEIIASQNRLFNLNQESLKGRRDALKQRVAQLEEQLVGRRAVLASARDQLRLFDQEAKTIYDLIQRGFERRARLIELQRSRSQLVTSVSTAEADLATTEQQLTEAKIQVVNIDAEARNTASGQRAQLEQELANLDSKLSATSDVLSRTRITAPVEGTVVNLRYHTIGGVINPSSPILDIVPDAEKLLVDVQISPMDIDVVHGGEQCLVRLTAYKQRSLPRIEGKLIYVAPDATQEPTGQSYYAGKVEVSQKELGKIQPAIQLVPGMPAEVAITTGTRTVMRYILDPLIASFQRSFVED